MKRREADLYKQLQDAKKQLLKLERGVEVEAALEKVRSRTMIMHHSDELRETVGVLFDQLKLLDFNLQQCSLTLIDDKGRDIESWQSADVQSVLPMSFRMSFVDHPMFHKLAKQGVFDKKGYTVTVYTGEQKKEFDDFIFTYTPLKHAPKQVIEFMFSHDKIILCRAHMAYGFVEVVSNSAPLTDEKAHILMRFAKVFEQTYTRFLDLKKAESQAREARIEAALERIRAAAMAMHSSQGLADVTAVLREQLALLGQKELESCILALYDRGSDTYTAHYTYKKPNGDSEEFVQDSCTVPWKETAWSRSVIEHYLGGETHFSIHADHIMLKEWYAMLAKVGPETVEKDNQGNLIVPEELFYDFATFSGGLLWMVAYDKPSRQTSELLDRAAATFDIAYRRYLDLLKAEKQAREAQIEAALERVRSRTMAMHHSDELTQTASQIFKQLELLGIKPWTFGFNVWHSDEPLSEAWSSSGSSSIMWKMQVPHDVDPILRDIFQNRDKNIPFHHALLSGDALRQHIDYMFSLPGMAEPGDRFATEEVRMPSLFNLYAAYFNGGYLLFVFDEEIMGVGNLFTRFANVFEQTYTRFLDLKRAEEQAREAQIQAALERVRASTMAMHRSEELAKVSSFLFDELRMLGGELWSCGLVLCNLDKREAQQWMSAPGMGMLPPLSISPDLSPNLQNMFAAWSRKEVIYTEVVQGKELMDHYALMRTIPQIKAIYDRMEGEGVRIPTWQKNHVAAFKYGYLLIITTEEYQDVGLFSRFARVFEQTYTRFLDLKQAEAQARESQIEASLEKVRSRTMAMQRSDELLEVAQFIFIEFQRLGKDPFDVSIFHLDHDLMTLSGWSAIPSGESLSVFTYTLPPTNHPLIRTIFEQNLQQKQREIYFLAGEDKADYDDLFFQAIPIPEMEKIFRSIKSCYVNLIYNSNGGLAAITPEPLPDAELDLLQRFSKVVDLSYTRFLDLQKAEEQTREAQIEAALERVRAASMAMHRSSELPEVTLVMVNQLADLNIRHLGSSIILVSQDQRTYSQYSAHDSLVDQKKILNIVQGLDGHSIYLGRELLRLAQEGKRDFTIPLVGEELHEFITYTRDQVHWDRGEAMLKAGFECIYFHFAVFHGLSQLVISTTKPLNDEECKVLRRMADTFSMSYRRYLDLMKAEAQAREAQIEASLERVRASSMAMHSSQDLFKSAAVLFEQIKFLGAEVFASGFVLCEKGRRLDEQWMSVGDSELMVQQYSPHADNLEHENMYQAWINGEELLTQVMEGDRMEELKAFLSAQPSVKENMRRVMEAGLGFPARQIMHCAPFKKGYLLIITTQEYAEKSIFPRFANVFEQTYTRFLDLKNAEHQADEARIEASLERVRAKTMAMHKSGELLDAAVLLSKELINLGIPHFMSGFILIDEIAEKQEVWMGVPGQEQKEPKFFLPLIGDSILEARYESWKKGEPIFHQQVSGRELARHMEYVTKHFGSPEAEETAGMMPDPVIFYCGNFREGYLEIISQTVLNEEQKSILVKFTKVFQQTFTRFLDLQKAEAQAREAQIEAAMERIRSRALAMRNSEEIMDVITELRRQIDSLGQLDLEASVVHLYSEGEAMFESIAAVRPPGESGEIVLAHVLFPVNAMDQIKHMMAMYKSAIMEYTIEFNKEMAEEWQQVMVQYAPMIAERRVGFVDNRRLSEHSEFWNFADFSEGSLLLVTHSPASEDTLEVLRKAAQVFDLAYRRYRDLQRAEARAREAQIESAMERVRAASMSMHKSSDLSKTAQILFQQLEILDIKTWAVGFNICEEGHSLVLSYTSLLGKLHSHTEVPHDKDLTLRNVYQQWQIGSDFYTEEMSGTLLEDHYAYMNEIHQGVDVIQDLEQAGFTIPKSPSYQIFNAAYFKFGYLMFITFEFDPDHQIIFQRFAQVFEQAYIRFLDLKKTEEQAVRILQERNRLQSTLQELKSAQSQLIQSEKMASLGELTAGIAHEIQNPLNFVTNFSEINKELLIELKEVYEKGDHEEVYTLISDLLENEEKVMHHGKRADAIVKGMLQHSRISSGVKEPTDINSLVDEYLRLAYHGLRAKDKSFNTEMVTDYATEVGKIEIVPQDIGRVVLNLINNAFYAVNEKVKTGIAGYRPTVSVSTKMDDNQVVISIADNGPGIPDHIKEKIFQPFFTTKPTGHGTGLGLSLSYDIVKAHGGEVKVESEKEKGSAFTISLPDSASQLLNDRKYRIPND